MGCKLSLCKDNLNMGDSKERLNEINLQQILDLDNENNEQDKHNSDLKLILNALTENNNKILSETDTSFLESQLNTEEYIARLDDRNYSKLCKEVLQQVI